MNVERARSWRDTYQAQPETKQEERRKGIAKRRSWLTRGEKIIYSIFALAIVFACYYVVSFSAQTDQVNREIQQLEKTIAVERVQNENLQFKIDELSKPDRIIAIAEKLGLKIQDTKVKRAQLIND